MILPLIGMQLSGDAGGAWFIPWLAGGAFFWSLPPFLVSLTMIVTGVMRKRTPMTELVFSLFVFLSFLFTYLNFFSV
jgi:hypothetical protein